MRLMIAPQINASAASRIGGTGITLYSFSHPLWREVISQQILQEFKDRIQRLIDSIVKSSEHVTYHEFFRDFSERRTMPVRT